MTKPVIVTRLGKGSELTFQEGDDNFVNLRDATINVSADSGSTQNIELNGTITVAGGTGVTTSANNGVITVNGFDGEYDSLNNKPALFSGNYEDLNNKPALFDGEYTSLNGAPTLATVATSGAYSDLSGTPTLATVATSGSYTDLSDKPTIPTNNNELTNGAGYITGIASGDVTTALGYTPENAANKNANNGYAGLDANGKVAAAQLPSFVDDVLEFADLAAFPGTGETGKIYVAIDTGKIYRWSGSVYVEISASPGSTDSVTEGTTNLYFTQQRARDSFTAGTNISLTNGEISVTGSLGATQINDLSDVDTQNVTSGDTLVWTGTEFRASSQLSGSTINGNVTAVDDEREPNTLTLDTFTGLGVNSEIQFTGSQVTSLGLVENQTYYIAADLGGGTFEITDTFSGAPIAITDPGTITDVQFSAQTQSIEWLNLDKLSDVSIAGTPGNGNVLAFNAGSNKWEAQSPAPGGLTAINEDPNPQLGGNLDVNGNTIVSVNDGNITLAPNGTGKTITNRLNYNEAIHSIGTTSGTVAPDAANGNVQTITLNGNLTLNAFTSPVAGQSITLIVNTGGTGRTLTSSMKFAGGEKTLSTTNTTDIISIFYDGTNYWASLSNDFK
jgi:hypothetical protein